MPGFVLALHYSKLLFWVSEDTWKASGVVHFYQESVIPVSFFSPEVIWDSSGLQNNQLEA